MRMRNLLLILAFIVLCGCVAQTTNPAAAQTAPPATVPSIAQQPPAPTTQAAPANLAQLQQQMIQQFAAKNYQQAVQICEQLLAIQPKDFDTRYNLACTLARLGRTDDALAALQKAVDDGWPDAEHMSADDDLTSLRNDPRFAQAVAGAKKGPPTAPSKRARAIAGVKTLEALPEGGLRYRLRMSPDANQAKPNKLIVWLHPSGTSGDAAVEKLVPTFIKHGYALVVFTQKQYNGWTPPEAMALFNHTLPALGKIPGIDARKPILMGFSAGGQLALQVWGQHPGEFGGMILDAAYPLDMQRYMQHQAVLQELPNDPAVKQTPILALVGQADPEAQFWKQAQTVWGKAGVPLVVQYVAGAGHSFLLGGKQTPDIEAWLTKVAAGQKPATTLPQTPTPAAPTNPDGMPAGLE